MSEKQPDQTEQIEAEAAKHRVALQYELRANKLYGLIGLIVGIIFAVQIWIAFVPSWSPIPIPPGQEILARTTFAMLGIFIAVPFMIVGRIRGRQKRLEALRRFGLVDE